MLGLYSVWQGPENGVCAKLGIQKKNEIFLGYSRDGFHFYRPSFKPFMAVNETEGSMELGKYAVYQWSAFDSRRFTLFLF